jgi:hypothetical protein
MITNLHLSSSLQPVIESSDSPKRKSSTEHDNLFLLRKGKKALSRKYQSDQEMQQKLLSFSHLPLKCFKQIVLFLDDASLLALDATSRQTQVYMQDCWATVSQKKWLQITWKTTEKQSAKLAYWINKLFERYVLHDEPLKSYNSDEEVLRLQARYGRLIQRFPMIGFFMERDLEEKKSSKSSLSPTPTDLERRQVIAQLANEGKEGGELLLQGYLEARTYLSHLPNMIPAERESGLYLLKSYFHAAIQKGATLASLVAIRLFLNRWTIDDLLELALEAAIKGDLRAFQMLMTYYREHPQPLSLLFQNNVQVLKLALQQDGMFLQFASEALRYRSDLATLAVQQNGLAIRFVPKTLFNYAEIAELAVRQDGMALRYIPKDLHNYSKIVESAIRQNGLAIQFVSKDFLDYPRMAELAVQEDGMTLQYIPKELPNYSKIAELAVQKNSLAIQFVPKDLPDYSRFAELAVPQPYKEVLQYIPKDFPNYLQIFELALQQDGILLRYLPTDFAHYLQIAELVVKHDGMSLQFVSNDHPEYPRLAEWAVQQNGLALRDVLQNVPNYLRVAELAVQQNGLALQYVPKDLPDYPRLAELAVQQNGWALQYVPKKVSNYLKLVELAVQQNGLVLQIIPKDFPNYSRIAELAIQQNGLALQHASDAFRNDPRFATDAIRKAPAIFTTRVDEQNNENNLFALPDIFRNNPEFRYLAAFEALWSSLHNDDEKVYNLFHLG